MYELLFLIICLIFVLILIYFGTGFNVKNISPNEVKIKLSDFKLSKKIGIIDVRTKKEYDLGHIENSICMPLSDLNNNIDKIKTFNFDEIYTICLSGSRSAQAVNILKKNNIKATNIRGGMISWKSS
tara:strand:+ start:524 stop:904 length:381 start_codon:yes stop_codon:yes gene_type:complete